MIKKNTGPKIQEEKATVSAMIQLYYLKHSHEMIDQMTLHNYAMHRLDVCRFGEDKPTCKQCPVHCYRREYKEQMRKVMRYSGPRMLFYHPVLAIKHLLKEKRHQKKNNGNFLK